MRFAFVLLLASLFGCGGGSSAPRVDPTRDRLSKIVQVYFLAEQELKRPPKNAEDLKPAALKKGYGEELWISENDGKPFEIVWGIDLNKPGPTMPILAHEKEGRSGVKWAVDMMGATSQRTDDEIKKARGS
jgi:hypothetical protein